MQEHEDSERADEISELDTVIPEEKLVAAFFPVKQFLFILGTAFVRVNRNRNTAVCFDVAQHNMNIVRNFRDFRRFACIPVSER